MRQPADPDFGVVEQNGHTTAQPDRDQDVVADAGFQISHPDQQLPATHAARR